MSRKRIGLIAVLIFTSSYAQANIIRHYLLEPYAGYGQATSDVVATPYATVPVQPGQTIANFQLTGLGYGIRLGTELDYYGLTLAGDYFSSSISGTGLSEVPGQFGIKRNLALTTMGVLVGCHLPTMPLRFWAEYLFYAVGSDVSDYNHGQTATGPSSYKIGIGYYLNSYLTMSLEYADISLSRTSFNYQDFTYFYGKEDVRLAMFTIGFDFGAFFR